MAVKKSKFSNLTTISSSLGVHAQDFMLH